MKRWVYTLIALNIVDMVSTLAAVKMGWATEANPLMRVLLDFSPWAFVAAKSVLGCLVPLLLLQSTAMVVFRAVKILTCAYAVLVAWHVINWIYAIRYLS